MAWKALISQFKLQHDSHRGSSPFRRAVFFRCCSCSSACHATCHECGRRYFSRYSGLQPFHKIEVFAADRRSHPRPDLPDLQVPELLELEHCALRLIQMLYLFDPASSCKMTRVCRRSKRGDIVFAYFAHAFLASPCFAFVAFAGFASLSSSAAATARASAMARASSSSLKVSCSSCCFWITSKESERSRRPLNHGQLLPLKRTRAALRSSSAMISSKLGVVTLLPSNVAPDSVGDEPLAASSLQPSMASDALRSSLQMLDPTLADLARL